MQLRSRLARLVCSALFLVSVSHADVLLVHDGTAQLFPGLPDAMSAAADGDLLLLGAGTYGGFLLEARSLRLVALPGQQVVFTQSIAVRNLPRGGVVVLDGIQIRIGDLGACTGQYPLPYPTSLRIENCAGEVRVQHCTIDPGVPTFGFGCVDSGCVPAAGGIGVSVTGSPRVALSQCAVRGGRGGAAHLASVTCTSGVGGDALAVATSTVVLHDVLLRGGDGGDNLTLQSPAPGAGGAGARLASGRVFASAGSITGGVGATGGTIASGAGGDGIVAAAGTLVRVRSTTLAGGAGGNGPAGSPASGAGAFAPLASPARSIDLPGIVADASSATLTVTGFAGDRLFVAASEVPGFHFGAGAQAPWLLAFPSPTPTVPVPLFTLPANGTFTVALPTPDLVGAVGARTFVQGWIEDLAGDTIQSTPLHVVMLDGAAAPDCDANGVFDVLDVAAGASDCDGDLRPDACQPDCNANGTPDPCDIASGTSLDRDGNEVPDECQPTQLWVDVAAPPGGDGGPFAPFQTIAPAVAIAAFQSTIHVQPGTYTGPENRNLDFGGKAIVLEGVGGSTACVLDAQYAGGPFVRLHGNEPVGTRVTGFTMRGARLFAAGSQGGAAVQILDASLVLSDCTFVDDRAAQFGGAVYASDPFGFHDVHIERCTFTGNQLQTSATDSYRLGGALFLNGPIRVLACRFGSNRAPYGGAIGSWGRPLAPTISHCTFERNSATLRGGAVFAAHGAGIPELHIDDCLFQANSAVQDGGAAAVGPQVSATASGRLVVTGCTFAGNVALQAGGVFGMHSSSMLEVYDSILWNNVAPLASAIVQTSPGTAPGSIVVEFCDVQGDLGSVSVAGSVSWVANFDADPLFVDPDGPDGNPMTFGDNDLSLQLGSPCIDAGAASLLPPDRTDVDGDLDTNEPVPWDLRFLTRVIDVPSVPNGNSALDLGCYEHP